MYKIRVICSLNWYLYTSVMCINFVRLLISPDFKMILNNTEIALNFESRLLFRRTRINVLHTKCLNRSLDCTWIPSILKKFLAGNSQDSNKTLNNSTNGAHYTQNYPDILQTNAIQNSMQSTTCRVCSRYLFFAIYEFKSEMRFHTIQQSLRQHNVICILCNKYFKILQRRYKQFSMNN